MGDMLLRQDAVGDYYEIRAAERSGNQGGICPMLTGGLWARRVTVRAESYWMIADHDAGAHVNPNGTGSGQPDGLAGNDFAFPGLPKWALIAMWVAGEDVITRPFFAGTRNSDGHYGGTFDVPIPAAIIPQPGTGSYDYRPPVKLLYFCNDNDYSDNAGWLHVRELYHN